MRSIGSKRAANKPLFFMAITKEKKAEILKKLKQSLADSKTAVFVNFAGLSVNEATELRRELRNMEVGYMVAKKTLIKRALNETGASGEMPELPGEVAVAFGVDLVAPAKGVYDFGQKSKKLDILGGIFEGSFMDKASMMEIAEIPPREILYGKLANVINSPIQGLVIALDQLAEKKA